MGFFSDVFTGKADRKAADAISRNAQQGKQAAFGQLDTGLSQFKDYYGQADNLYEPLANTANQGFSAYGDFAGLGGAEGYGRSREAFKTDPGYQFQQDEALRAATRAASAGGQLASGNTLMGVADRAQGIADQSYDRYGQRLSPFLSLAPQIAGQRAGMFADIGQQSYNTASDKAGIERDTSNTIGGAEAFRATAGQRAGVRGINTGLGALKTLGSLYAGFS